MVEGLARESRKISNSLEMLGERQPAQNPGEAQSWTKTAGSTNLLSVQHGRDTASQGITLNLPLAAPAPQQTRDKAFLDWLNFFCLSQALKITLHQCFQSTCEIRCDTKPALPNSCANWLMLLHPLNHQPPPIILTHSAAWSVSTELYWLTMTA